MLDTLALIALLNEKERKTKRRVVLTYLVEPGTYKAGLIPFLPPPQVVANLPLHIASSSLFRIWQRAFGAKKKKGDKVKCTPQIFISGQIGTAVPAFLT